MKSFKISVNTPHSVANLHRDSKDIVTCIDIVLKTYKKTLIKVTVIDIKT